MRYLVFKILLCCFLFLEADAIIAQNNTTSTADSELINDARREEIQRYFGYELLLYRYLSLPYDVSVNNNQQGNFVDIGYLYLLFIPVLLLVFLKPRRWLFLLVLLYLIFMWIISTSNAFLFSLNSGKIPTELESIASYLRNNNFSDEPFSHLLAIVYTISLTLYQPFAYVGLGLSGNSDTITYPLVFTLFIGMSMVLAQSLHSFSIKKKLFVVFFWTYSFYWLVFSGGIIWYGYILLLMGILYIAMIIKALKERKDLWYKPLRYAFIFFGSLWVFLAIAMRTSDIQPMMDKKYFAKAMFNPVFYDYTAGKLTKDQSLDILYADISKALKRINVEDSSLILRVGTSFSYFIDNNHKRIIEDNQLGLFHELNTKYPDKLELVDVFKASKIKYIVLDLNTASIDYTPDQSLTRKYKEILRFIVNNPYLKLLATDRVVGNRNNSGQMTYTRRVFGEEISLFGRYAIFEII